MLGMVGVLMVVYGSVEAGENESGLELGFRIGDEEEVDEDGDEIMGTKVGIVVIGVVMSFFVVEITCDSFIVLMLDPVILISNCVSKAFGLSSIYKSKFQPIFFKQSMHPTN